MGEKYIKNVRDLFVSHLNFYIFFESVSKCFTFTPKANIGTVCGYCVRYVWFDDDSARRAGGLVGPAGRGKI